MGGVLFRLTEMLDSLRRFSKIWISWLNKKKKLLVSCFTWQCLTRGILKFSIRFTNGFNSVRYVSINCQIAKLYSLIWIFWFLGLRPLKSFVANFILDKSVGYLICAGKCLTFKKRILWLIYVSFWLHFNQISGKLFCEKIWETERHHYLISCTVINQEDYDPFVSRTDNLYSHPQTDLFRSIRTHQCG